MLRELRIENLLLIERAELVLGPGLNVLTGETGAGKTVLAHSLDLLMGGKARKDIVRPGASEAWVEGIFDLPPGLLADPELQPVLERLPAGAEELILGRRVSGSGRTSAFVGGRGATAGDLRLLTSRLIAFYGQHEHRRLTISTVQTATVDGAGDDHHHQLLDRYRTVWKEYRRLGTELDELTAGGGGERDLDLYRFELEEIERIRPEPGEPERIVAEMGRLRRAEDLREGTAAAAGGIRGDAAGPAGGGLLGELAAIRSRLDSLRGLDPELDGLDERLESLGLELDDVGQSLNAKATAIEGDPERLAMLEERVAEITRLERKHGGTVELVLAHADHCREGIYRLEGGEARAAELREELERARTELREVAAKLSESRARAADGLADRITADLDELAMAGAKFTVDLEPDPNGFGPAGAEAAEFMLAPNPGVPARPLKDTASGGELSRVMLALAASGSGDADGERTLVFDEIDAGIGGSTAGKVGDRLREVAAVRQVIAITHLPQVAARAATHFSVSKRVAGDLATASVSRLGAEERIDEVRRMLGAMPGDETATRHAAELIAAQA